MVGTKQTGGVKNSIGNGEAKELICTTHGHELREGECWKEWEYWVEGGKKENKWDNCNSIINIYFKNTEPKERK